MNDLLWIGTLGDLDLRPSFLGGLAEQLVGIGDEIFDFNTNATDGHAFGELVDQSSELLMVDAIEELRDCIADEDMFLCGIDQGPAWWEFEFQREGFS